METERALSILKMLSDGVHPATGEVFPPDSVYQQPDTLRALFIAVNILEADGRKTQKRRSLPENVGKPWSVSEDGELAAEFDKGGSIASIAEAHKRTRGSIQARLVRLGKITV